MLPRSVLIRIVSGIETEVPTLKKDLFRGGH